MAKREKREKKEFVHENLFKLDGDIPLLRALPYGIQHILAMFVANLTPIIIVAGAAGLSDAQTSTLIQSAMLVAGIGTLIQLFPIWKIGSGLPIVMGISFTFVTVLTTVAATYGYNAVIGAVLVGGIIEGVLGLFAKYWRKLIPPIVAACVVTSIGFSLLSVGATSFGGGSGAEDFGSAENLILGTISLVACLVFQVAVKGPNKQLSVLFGLIIGYVAALIMGKIDFSVFEGLTVFALPELMPFEPEFNASAILSVTLIFLVSATETTGDTSALAQTGLGRDVTDKELQGSITCDGFMSAISACFGCLPITSFSQNVGLVAMTKVVNRKAIASGAVIMIIAAFVPAISAVFSSLPEAVLGGCTIMMFGNIVVSGIQMMSNAGFSQRNVVIAALSLGIGIGFTQVSDLFVIFPELVQSVLADNCVAMVFLVAVIANLVLPKNFGEEDAKDAGSSEGEASGEGSGDGEAAGELEGASANGEASQVQAQAQVELEGATADAGALPDGAEAQLVGAAVAAAASGGGAAGGGAGGEGVTVAAETCEKE